MGGAVFQIYTTMVSGWGQKCLKGLLSGGIQFVYAGESASVAGSISLVVSLLLLETFVAKESASKEGKQ